MLKPVISLVSMLVHAINNGVSHMQGQISCKTAWLSPFNSQESRTHRHVDCPASIRLMP